MFACQSGYDIICVKYLVETESIGVNVAAKDEVLALMIASQMAK